jgi:membrane protease YdiL (CAAX protease family)
MNPLPPAPAFPAPLQAALLALAAGFMRAIVALLLASSFGFRIGIVGIATIVGFGLAFAFAAPRVPAPPAASLGFGPASRWAWYAVPLLVPILLLVSELDNAVPGPDPAPPGSPLDVPAWIELSLVTVAVLPICEEIFFRGLLQPGLVSALGAAPGVLGSALLQGATWLVLSGPRALLFPVCTGIVLGILRQSSSSLLPGLLLHGLFGVTTVLAQAGVFGIPGFDDTQHAHTPLEFLAPAALLAGVGLGLCRLAGRS